MRASEQHPREQWVRAGVGARVQKRGKEYNAITTSPSRVPSCWLDRFPWESRPHWPHPYYLSHAPRDRSINKVALSISINTILITPCALRPCLLLLAIHAQPAMPINARASLEGTGKQRAELGSPRCESIRPPLKSVRRETMGCWVGGCGRTEYPESSRELGTWSFSYCSVAAKRHPAKKKTFS